jgi:hypothetical protein
VNIRAETRRDAQIDVDTRTRARTHSGTYSHRCPRASAAAYVMQPRLHAAAHAHRDTCRTHTQTGMHLCMRTCRRRKPGMPRNADVGMPMHADECSDEYMHTHTQAWPPNRRYASMKASMYMRPCANALLHQCLNASMPHGRTAHMSVCLYVCMSVCLYVCASVCLYSRIYTDACVCAGF